MNKFVLLLITTLFVIGIGAGALNSGEPHHYETDAYTARVLQKQASSTVAFPTSPHVTRAYTTASSSQSTPLSTSSIEKAPPSTVVTFTATQNESVLEAMRGQANLHALMFTSHHYPALGEFIDSINGVKNSNGLYWFLYINGISSNTGASTALIHSGDVVEWRYQKSQ